MPFFPDSVPQKKSPNKDLDFGQELWRTAHRGHVETNQVLSPLVSDMIMYLVSYGAKGVCQEELKMNIKLPSELNMTTKLCELMKSVTNTTGVSCHVVCGLYLPWRAPAFRPDLILLVETKYHGEIKAINYANPEKAAEHINNWISHSTNLKIPKLIRKGDITKESQLTLLSAIYFKGLWKQNYSFMTSQTTVKPFLRNDGTYVDVQMMTNDFQCLYAIIEDYNCRAVGIPYEGDQYVFVLVLPDEIHGLAALEKQADSNFFQDFRLRLRPWPHDIHVEIPKFSIRSRIDLIPILKQMELRTMFGMRSNFGGYFVDGKGNYRFTTLIQKVFFEISEEGGRSHHAFQARGRHRHSEDFLAHHPFLFFVYDDKTDSVIISGTVSNFEPTVMKESFNKDRAKSRKNFALSMKSFSRFFQRNKDTRK